MADELERLTAQFDADIARFEKKMDQMGVAYNRQASQIDASHKSLITRMNAGFARLDVGKIAGLVGGVALLDRMIDKSKELSESTLSVSKATGVSAEAVQGLGIIARKAGVDQGSFNQSLEFFSAAMGQAQLKQTDFGRVMAALGVNIKQGPEAALLSLSDKLTKLPKAQQDAVAKLAFGKSGVQDIAWITQGSDAIRKQIEQFKQLGLIVPADKLEKINQAFDALEDVKLEALVGFMSGFSAFAGQVQSPAFQKAIKDFGTVMGEIAGIVVKIAPHLPAIATAFGGYKVGSVIGPVGGIAGAALGYAAGETFFGQGPQTPKEIKDRIATLQRYQSLGFKGPGVTAELAALQARLANPNPQTAAPNSAPKTTGKSGGMDIAGLLDQNRLAGINAQIKGLNKEIGSELRGSFLEASDAAGDLEKAQMDAFATMSKGAENFFEIQKGFIEHAAELDIQKIKDRRDTDIAAIKDRQAAELARVNALDTSPAVRNTESDKVKAAAQQEIQNAKDTAEARIGVVNVRAQSEIAQAGAPGLLNEALNLGRQQIQQYNDEAEVVGRTAGEVAKFNYIHEQLNLARERGIELTEQERAAIEKEGDAVGLAAQKAHDAQLATERATQASDEIRQGLEDVGAAGLKGFDNLADAAENFIAQLAEMILRLYVLRPLLDSVLGEAGTPIGGGATGIFGNLGNSIANLFGAGNLAANTTAAIAANPLLFDAGGYTGAGGKYQPAGIVHKGEYVFDQDAVRRIGVPALRALQKGYADGGLVGLPYTPSIPQLQGAAAAGRGLPGITLNIDARYATKGVAEEIKDQLLKAYPAMVRSAVTESRREFPANLSNTLRDRA
jgi:lambda family phage tail tape measure protein